MTIMQRMLAVMQDVGAVRKGEKNAAQGFNFRGIDSVVNAVAPALKKNGVLVVPVLQTVEYAQVEVGKNRTPMLQCRVIVQYVFAAEDGTTLAATVAAEALDSGDKATAKAMSVAKNRPPTPCTPWLNVNVIGVELLVDMKPASANRPPEAVAVQV